MFISLWSTWDVFSVMGVLPGLPGQGLLLEWFYPQQNNETNTSDVPYSTTAGKADTHADQGGSESEVETFWQDSKKQLEEMNRSIKLFNTADESEPALPPDTPAEEKALFACLQHKRQLKDKISICAIMHEEYEKGMQKIVDVFDTAAEEYNKIKSDLVGCNMIKSGLENTVEQLKGEKETLSTEKMKLEQDLKTAQLNANDVERERYCWSCLAMSLVGFLAFEHAGTLIRFCKRWKREVQNSLEDSPDDIAGSKVEIEPQGPQRSAPQNGPEEEVEQVLRIFGDQVLKLARYDLAPNLDLLRKAMYIFRSYCDQTKNFNGNRGKLAGDLMHATKGVLACKHSQECLQVLEHAVTCLQDYAPAVAARSLQNSPAAGN
jgi:hypothetical protein